MVVGICIAKDEADIIQRSVTHALGQFDMVFVKDNMSTDGTREMLQDLWKDSHSLTIGEDSEAAYYQSRKMSIMAEIAYRRWNAEWIVPFDADEFWVADHPDDTVADVLRGQKEAIVPASLFDHPAFGRELDGDPVARMPYRRVEALLLPKVACRPYRPVTIHAGNHGADYGVSTAPEGLLHVHHFPYRSPGQFVRKVRNGAAAYKQTDLPQSTGQHWREYGKHLEENGEEGLINDIFLPNFHAETADGLVHDPV